jgi:hypothetical protein
MKVSMGMTNAAVLPEPKYYFRARSIKWRTRHLTSLSNSNNIAILQTNRDSLSLDGGWFFVTNLIDDFKNLGWDGRFLPGS